MLLFVFYEDKEYTSITLSKLDIEQDGVTYWYKLLLFLLCGSFCFFHQRPKIEFTNTFSIFVIYIWCISLLHETNSIFGFFIFSANILLPLFFLYYFYHISQSIDTNFFYLVIVIASLALLNVFLNTYEVQLFYAVTDEVRTSSLYLYLFIVPLFLMSKNRFVRWGSLTIVAVAMVFSLKRGGMLAFALALAVFYVVNIICTGGKAKLKSVIIVLFSIAAIYYVVIIGFGHYFDEMFLRFSAISDDGGSSRDLVYEVTWRMIANSNLTSLLLGHGWNRVVVDSPMALSAHNDFMEVLYDFGIFALLLYVYLYYRLFKTLFGLIRQRSETAAPFAFSVITFTVNSSIAHIVLYPFNFIVFAAVWGYILGKEQHCRKLMKIRI